jgi:hypothetical protein
MGRETQHVRVKSEMIVLLHDTTISALYSYMQNLQIMAGAHTSTSQSAILILSSSPPQDTHTHMRNTVYTKNFTFISCFLNLSLIQNVGTYST